MAGYRLMFTLGSALLMLVCAEAVNARFHSRDFNNAVSSCPSGKYYDLKLKECRKCSFCPVNEIVRRPCHKHRDTVCGPFTEFERFNQAPSEEKGNTGEAASRNAITNKINKAEGFKAVDETKQEENKDVYETVLKEKSGKSQSQEPGLASVTTDADEQWRLLALVLIGVLSVVSLLLVIFVFIACYMLKRKRMMEKTIICSS
ncbi:uncharacterized protein LOC135481706, partial [Liolophura sinensis]|uniref:uncharacterized protein LOC135481706 n=1 Tax=Liolophura sinensis TaxID=3198878 RepID=UPI003158D850